MMENNRDIKIYGTLLNATVNPNIGDNDHNDAIAYAKLLYDNNFGDENPVNNFQDVINKRVTAISYNNGTTTIDSDLTVNGNYHMDGSVTFDNISVTGNVTSQNINQLRSDVDLLNSSMSIINSKVTINENNINNLTETTRHLTFDVESHETDIRDIKQLIGTLSTITIQEIDSLLL